MKKGDKIALIVIGVMLIISTLGVAIFKYTQKSTDHPMAIIKQDGKVIKRIDLSKVKKKETFNIYYKDKDYNTVALEPNRIRFSKSTCPDKICVKTGWLTKPGETSACLPHKLIIKIESNNSEVDEVSY
ncbi:NusG domain II-containing protein [Clostridium oceanicum]|uniref:NusG domain II-containing protein n=1 Tax=Clostridium oceanicum TaxID=1543 RepID=A0ABN1JR25_9CLOT